MNAGGKDSGSGSGTTAGEAGAVSGDRAGSPTPENSTGIRDIGLVQDNDQLLALCLVDGKVVAFKVNEPSMYDETKKMYEEVFRYDPATVLGPNAEVERLAVCGRRVFSATRASGFEVRPIVAVWDRYDQSRAAVPALGPDGQILDPWENPLVHRPPHPPLSLVAQFRAPKAQTSYAPEVQLSNTLGQVERALLADRTRYGEGAPAAKSA